MSTKVTHSLTVNLGIRYSFFNVFHEVANRAIRSISLRAGGYCAAGSLFTSRGTTTSTRARGIAWVHGPTVLRVGAGIYYSDGQEDDQNLPISNDVDRYTVIIVNEHKLIRITEPEQTTDKKFKNIQILSPAEAWAKSEH